MNSWLLSRVGRHEGGVRVLLDVIPNPRRSLIGQVVGQL